MVNSVRDDTFRMQSAKVIMRSFYLYSTNDSYLSMAISNRSNAGM